MQLRDFSMAKAHIWQQCTIPIIMWYSSCANSQHAHSVSALAIVLSAPTSSTNFKSCTCFMIKSMSFAKLLVKLNVSLLLCKIPNLLEEHDCARDWQCQWDALTLNLWSWVLRFCFASLGSNARQLGVEFNLCVFSNSTVGLRGFFKSSG